MRKYIFFFLFCILLTACGTHRSVISSTSGTKGEKPAKEVRYNIEYKGLPWVENISKPINITRGLQNKHLSVWASHGRYYDQNKDIWKWQRPNMFCTNEDLFTQTIVVPYLIPMLENAGAIVFTPRERDWQKNEVVVDNDDETKLPYYTEINIGRKWEDAGTRGFAASKKEYGGRENPFNDGTARMAAASPSKECEISYQPRFAQSGEYAVYVSYPTHKRSVPDAKYIVYHKGRRTVFSVNQRMGGGTWVYLGTFEFDQGCNSANRVVLTNESAYQGVVTADAVRFGGGMGLIARDGKTSGLPKCLEGARYYAQWAGAPESVYRAKNGTDDYKEDIYTRPFMTNWLVGGSCFAPDDKGLNVPIELALAVHSDAGYSKDYSSLVGSLAICTTNTGNGLLASGYSRRKSKTLASMLLDNANNDIVKTYGKWNIRNLYDRNYAETRCPVVPSAIIETLSHQNFPDMFMAQDPNFRFTLARSIYKSILRFNSEMHGTQCVVTPLAPINVSTEFFAGDTIIVRWDAQPDAMEPTAIPQSYILYTSIGDYGFDNGIRVNGTACKIKLAPNTLYNFKISAVNEGGESFTSEVVSALYNPDAEETVLIVNGFQRLAAPAPVNDDTRQGFDLDADPGVSFGKTLGFAGRQICFDKSEAGKEGEGSLGYSGNELAGHIIAGNDFNYIPIHAKAIMSAGKYNIASCSKFALGKNVSDLGRYGCIDLILGLEKDDGYSLRQYKTFTPKMQSLLSNYTRQGGNLIVSGAYVGSDMRSREEVDFINNVLHISSNGTIRPGADNAVNGMGTSFNIYTTLNEFNYAAASINLISPIKPAFCALTESNGHSVCVAYKGDRFRTFTMGFPFECITSEKKQSLIMRGILDFIFN